MEREPSNIIAAASESANRQSSKGPTLHVRICADGSRHSLSASWTFPHHRHSQGRKIDIGESRKSLPSSAALETRFVKPVGARELEAVSR